MNRAEQAQAWAELTEARLSARDPLASQANALAALVYVAVPGHRSPERVIAGALLDFARGYVATERAHIMLEAQAALAGEVARLEREFARVLRGVRVGQ